MSGGWETRRHRHWRQRYASLIFVTFVTFPGCVLISLGSAAVSPARAADQASLAVLSGRG
jgi:hypothetical protein